MATFAYEEIVQKIHDEKALSKEEIHARVKQKLQQLSDLVSKEGAAHIVANELGVRVYQSPTAMLGKRVSIQELDPGFRSVELLVKVLKIQEVRSFKTASREGRVANVLIGDETGSCRLVLWDEKQIKELEMGVIREGMLIKLQNCYVRENTFGGREVHMGSQARWVLNPPGEVLGEVQEFKSPEKKAIKDLAEHENVTVIGTIVQIFEPRFYDSCPRCGKKVEVREEGFACAVHGKVESAPQAVLNMVFDDGTENIRVVCFRDLVKQVLEVDEVQSLRDNADKFREIQRKVAGKQLKIQGKVTMNSFFNRLELLANSIEDANPKELALELNG